MKKLNFHSIQLNRIKGLINATFIGYERTKDSYSLKVKKKGFETKWFPLHGTPEDVTMERYLELNKTLQDYYGTL